MIVTALTNMYFFLFSITRGCSQLTIEGENDTMPAFATRHTQAFVVCFMAHFRSTYFIKRTGQN